MFDLREHHETARVLLGGPGVFSIRQYGREAGELLAASFVINLIALAMPIFTMVVYNKVIGNEVPATLWALALGALLFGCLEFILRSLRAFYLEHVGTRWDVLFDHRLMSAITRLPIDKLPSMGAVMHRYREAAATRDFLSSSYLLALADLPFLPIFLLAILLIGNWIVFVPLVLGVLLFGLLTFTHVMSQSYQRAALGVSSQKMSGLSEAVQAGEILRHIPLAGGLLAKSAAMAEEVAQLNARSRYWHALGMNGAAFIASLGTIITVLVGVYLVEAEKMSMGGLIAGSALVGRVLAAVHSLVSVRTRYQDFMEAIRRLSEDIPGAVDPMPEEEAQTFAGLGEGAPRLTLDKVHYRYSTTGHVVLQDINLLIEPGERIALVGRTGSGKSTLLRIIAGLVQPSEGRYMADNLLVDARSSVLLRARVALKGQDPQLIQGTLAENVLGSAGQLDAKRVVELLKAVGLGHALHHGELALNTDVGPFGGKLSGGQKQMIALARALGLDRPILILDEPTLGLDQTSLLAVINAISLVPASTTVIFATHSSELISLAQRIVVLDGGRKVADGPRDKILMSGPEPK